MSLPVPAAKIVVPVIRRFPLSVIAPTAVTPKFPVRVSACRSKAEESPTVTFAKLPALAANATVPEKALPMLLTLILEPFEAVNMEAPETASAPVLVMSPVVAVTV